jgi:hypothetical protein
MTLLLSAQPQDSITKKFFLHKSKLSLDLVKSSEADGAF